MAGVVLCTLDTRYSIRPPSLLTVAPVGLDGVVPTLDTVKSGVYPVARGLYSNTKGEPSGLAALLIAYLYSDEGRQIISEKGFIAVARENQP